MNASRSPSRPARRPRPALPPALDDWARERLGKAGADLRTRDFVRLPKLGGLRYHHDKGTRSPLGGRLPMNLRHLDDREAITLLVQADAFLDGRPAPKHSEQVLIQDRRNSNRQPSRSEPAHANRTR